MSIQEARITAMHSIAWLIYRSICDTLIKKKKIDEKASLKYIQNQITENVVEHKLYSKFAKMIQIERNLKKASDFIEYWLLSIELFLYDKQIEGYNRVMESANEELRITREMESKRTCDCK